MNVCEPGQDRNVAALSIMFMCGGFLNYMENDKKYIKEAIREAKLAALEDEVPIGCIIVKNGEIIARAHNQRDKTNNPRLMCAGAIIQSRISRVIYGAPDIKGGAFGSSLNVLDAKNINHRPEIIGGILADECSQIIKDYFKSKRS